MVNFLAEAFPLTCQWCKNSPASHLLTFDPKKVSRRVLVLLCHRCAHRDDKALQAVAGKLAWLYELHPDRCGTPQAQEGDAA